MRSLNLDQLRTLTEVIALGSFSAAGRRLNLTQPAISLHIRELEQRFAVRLIERRGRQAIATAPGQELVEQARQILLACEGAELVMRRFREGWIGRVSIGTTLTALTYQLPPILRKLRRDHPGIDLMVTNMATRDSVDHVLKDTLDLALVTLPVKGPGLRVTPLRPETLVALFPPDAENVPAIVTPAFVAGQSLVMEHTRGAVYGLVMQWLAGHLPLARAPMCIGTIEAVKMGVASGLGMSIVPDVAVQNLRTGVFVRPLQPAIPCTVGLIEQQMSRQGPAFDIVRNALLELQVLDDGLPVLQT